MGMTYSEVTVAGRSATRKLTLIVDTGSLYTWISRERLRGIGVKPIAKRTFRTITGEEITRDVGEATFEIIGERATRIVVFAEQDDSEVLGVDALEGLGLEVDPTTKELRKVRALAAYLSAAR